MISKCFYFSSKIEKNKGDRDFKHHVTFFLKNILRPPFYASSPISLFFLLHFFLLPLFFGRFSLLPKPLLSPLIGGDIANSRVTGY